MPPIVYVYTLTNPITKEIYYVGQTKDILTRLQTHCSINHFNGDRVVRHMPIIEVLDTCEEANKLEVEGYWINQMIAWGFDLKNGWIPGIRSKRKKTNTHHLKPGRLNFEALKVLLYHPKLGKELSFRLNIDLGTYYDLIRENSHKLLDPYILLRLKKIMCVKNLNKLVNDPA